ncbi:EAL domain protein (plasmid) [Thermovibrio ammonificans HB-1]|uniref:EAL domain protein n=1 Tax=Thermovibrio ammonificans (strain DSM 15698 / JCM 12110 / HB-1) TaxID=648996 RepID=E8T6Y1_THEA1|nr:EAL domain-containing protein [Thermovibrio ammonificans]ADU97702.1 EAL domain protein [Thermovibrio ammonificans HB-1]
MRPKFFFQKIYRPDGSLLGVELFVRDFTVSPFTDLFIFHCALEEVSVRDIPVPVHINLFASSVRFVRWDEIAEVFGNRIVVELVEKDVQLHLTAMDSLVHSGITYALDDFGNGSANYSVLRELHFPVVKVDVEFTPERVIQELKETFGVPCVVAEKTTSCPYADALQSFKLHRPEPIENLEESLALEIQKKA